MLHKLLLNQRVKHQEEEAPATKACEAKYLMLQRRRPAVGVLGDAMTVALIPVLREGKYSHNFEGSAKNAWMLVKLTQL